jgi:hypothetical protein
MEQQVAPADDRMIESNSRAESWRVGGAKRHGFKFQFRKFQPLLKSLNFFWFSFGSKDQHFLSKFVKKFLFYLNSCALLKYLKFYDQNVINAVSTKISKFS